MAVRDSSVKGSPSSCLTTSVPEAAGGGRDSWPSDLTSTRVPGVTTAADPGMEAAVAAPGEAVGGDGDGELQLVAAVAGPIFGGG